MTPNKIKITDSISLRAISTDKFKTATVELSLSLPASPARIACNSLLMGVLRRGTQKYPSAASLNLALDELYATTVDIKSSVRGKNCVFTVTAELLDGAYADKGEDILSEVLGVLAELLLHPALEDSHFCAEFVEKEKKTALDSIKATLSAPRSYAEDICTSLLFRNEPLIPSLGELIPIIEGLGARELYSFYEELLRDSTLNFFYIGSDSPARVAELIGAHFSHFCGRATPPCPAIAAAPVGFVEHSEALPVNQGKLVMALRSGVCLGDEDYFAALLFNNVFGAIPSSKLFMNVREKLSLCYSCSSSYSIYNGDIRVFAGIDNANKDKTIAEILSQLEQIKSGNVSESELYCAKAAILHSYRGIYDYPSDLMAFYSSKALFGVYFTPEEASERILALTKEDVVTVANKLVLDATVFIEGTLDDADGEDYDE